MGRASEEKNPARETKMPKEVAGQAPQGLLPRNVREGRPRGVQAVLHRPGVGPGGVKSYKKLKNKREGECRPKQRSHSVKRMNTKKQRQEIAVQ